MEPTKVCVYCPKLMSQIDGFHGVPQRERPRHRGLNPRFHLVRMKMACRVKTRLAGSRQDKSSPAMTPDECQRDVLYSLLPICLSLASTAWTSSSSPSFGLAAGSS